MREPRDDSADEIKNEISKVTETIFNIVAKDKKEKHVAEDVSDAAMHEHRSDQREVSRDWRTWHSRRLYGLTSNRFQHEAAGNRPIIAGDDACRNCRKFVGELLVGPKTLKEDKHQDVNRDEHIVN